MEDIKKLMQEANDFVIANLAACCADSVEWSDTAILPAGKLREAGAMFGKVDPNYGLAIAEAKTKYEAMKFVIEHQP